MIRLAAISIILPLMLTACGVKGALQPKGKPAPMAPAGLHLKQQGDGILLSWAVPTHNQDGSVLKDLSGFRIDRYSYQQERYCPECRDQETIATISLDSPAPAIVQKGRFFYRDENLVPNTGYRYRIYPFSTSGKSGPAAQARQTVQVSPVPPIEITVEELDQGVRLFWTLPGSVQKQGDFLGINIYRGEYGSAFGPIPVNREPLKGNNFDNFGLQNGTTYQYGLRSVVNVDNNQVESELSEIVDATPAVGR